MIAQTSGPAATADLSDIVVTASRVTDRDPTVVLIPKEQIDRLAAPTALEALDSVPGLLTYSRGGIAGSSYLSMRGAEPNFTLVMVDGVPVNDPTNSQGGSFDFSQLDPAVLQSIEVVRRGTSAVLGANALAGAVQLRLLDPRADTRSADLSLHADSVGRLSGSATALVGHRQAGALLHTSALRAEDRYGAELNREQLLGKLSGSAGDLGWTALLLHSQTDRRGFPEESGGPRLAVNRAFEVKSSRLTVASASVRAQEPRPDLDLLGQASWSRQTAESRTPAIAPGVFEGVPALTGHTRYDRADLSGYGKVRSGAVTAVAGLAWTREAGRDDGTIDVGAILPVRYQRVRRTFGQFTELEVAQGGLTMTLGVRHDDPSDAAARWTGTATGRWQLSPIWAISAAAATSYKQPSIYALEQPLVGNPDLRPERARTAEIAVQYGEEKRRRVSATLFRTNYSGLIDFDPVEFRLVNRSQVQVTGAELMAAVAGRKVDIDASVTRLWYESPVALRARPDLKATLDARWRVGPALLVFGRAIYNGDVLDSAVPTGFVRRNGALDLAVGAGAKLPHAIQIRVTLAQVFGCDPASAIGYPRERTSLRATVSRSF